MYLEDFLPTEHLGEVFENLSAYTIENLSEKITIDLVLSNDISLQASAALKNAKTSKASYEVRITRRLVDLVYRFFFCLLCVSEEFNNISLPGLCGKGIDRPAHPGIENLEALLNQLEYDHELDDERVDILIDILNTSWNIILMHEIAHIVKGHIRYKYENKELFSANSAIARGCEIEADNTAATWLSQRLVINPPERFIAFDEQDGHGTTLARFNATVAACLFLVIKIHLKSTEIVRISANHPPIDLRNFLHVFMLASKAAWKTQEDQFKETLKSITDATRYHNLVSRWREPKPPTILTDINFEDYIRIHLSIIDEYNNNHSLWNSYQMTGKSNEFIWNELKDTIKGKYVGGLDIK